MSGKLLRFYPLCILTNLICLFLAGCGRNSSCAEAPAGEPCLRILFIGNSYTSVNDLPNTLAHLAQSGQHYMETGMAAPGGWTLADHAVSADTLQQISAQKWDYVVLQEQSQMSASIVWRVKTMYPAAAVLVEKIRQNNSQPLLFDTWAHSNGWPEEHLNDYAAMQNQVNQGYLEAARQMDVPLVLVGYAWASVRLQNPEIQLWQADGSHPSEQGTYLAACVFYAVLYQESPLGLKYQAGLSDNEVHALQSAAEYTVLGIKQP